MLTKTLGRVPPFPNLIVHVLRVLLHLLASIDIYNTNRFVMSY